MPLLGYVKTSTDNPISLDIKWTDCSTTAKTLGKQKLLNGHIFACAWQ
jgi:hypothetical protein